MHYSTITASIPLFHARTVCVYSMCRPPEGKFDEGGRLKRRGRDSDEEEPASKVKVTFAQCGVVALCAKKLVNYSWNY